MKIAIARQMRNIDERAIRTVGIPGIALMEKAGSGVVEVISRRYGPLRGKRIVFFCGGGNNGGDGFVSARYAANLGAEAIVFLLAKKEKIRGDARINLDVLERLGRRVGEVEDRNGMGEILEDLSGADLIVDALLGSGLSGEVKGLYRDAIEAINGTGRAIVSIDNPSGIDMDTGAVLGAAVMADLTVTLGLPKRGHFLYPGREYCGDLEVVDIGLPPEVVEEEGITVETLEKKDVERLLPDRRDDAHKGDFGHLLVLAGSVGYTGAAALSSLSALKVGAGLVTLGIPGGLNPAMEAKLTEVITRPLPETEDGSFSIDALDPMLELASGKDAVVLGPGLSRNEETGETVRDFLLQCDRPVVLDADGINALIGHDDILGNRTAQTVMTPHPGELGRLIGMAGWEINAHRIEVCMEYARKWNLVLVLKGAPTIVSEGGERSRINTTGNSGLATGGTGDVLTGAVGGFVAQGIDPFHAALCGTYYHGLAGDIAAARIGGRGMIAGDVMELLPEALRA